MSGGKAASSTFTVLVEFRWRPTIELEVAPDATVLHVKRMIVKQLPDDSLIETKMQHGFDFLDDKDVLKSVGVSHRSTLLLPLAVPGPAPSVDALPLQQEDGTTAYAKRMISTFTKQRPTPKLGFQFLDGKPGLFVEAFMRVPLSERSLPFAGGVFEVLMRLPSSGFERPALRFLTPMLHPLVDAQGRVYDFELGHYQPANMLNVLTKLYSLLTLSGDWANNAPPRCAPDWPLRRDRAIFECRQLGVTTGGQWQPAAREWTRRHAMDAAIVWSPDTHRSFGAHFKRAVMALLQKQGARSDMESVRVAAHKRQLIEQFGSYLAAEKLEAERVAAAGKPQPSAAQLQELVPLHNEPNNRFCRLPKPVLMRILAFAAPRRDFGAWRTQLHEQARLNVEQARLDAEAREKADRNGWRDSIM